MMHDIRWPLVIVLLSILMGTGLGAFFGAAEDNVKNYLETELKKNELNSQLGLPEKGKEVQEKLKNIKNKSWRYLLRAHFHGGAIASLSLALLLLLGHMTLSVAKKKWLGFGIAMSGFLYPFFWLFSGLYGPSMGTGAAKQKFEIFAYAGVLHVFFTFILLYFVLRGQLFGRKKDSV